MSRQFAVLMAPRMCKPRSRAMLAALQCLPHFISLEAGIRSRSHHTLPSFTCLATVAINGSNGSANKNALSKCGRFTRTGFGLTRSFGNSREYGLDGGNDSHDRREIDDDIIPAEVQSANLKYSGSLQIRKCKGQWGVYALQSFAKGELIICSRRIRLAEGTNTCITDSAVVSPCATFTSPSAHSIQIGVNEHINMDLPARFLNHSCDANIGVSGDLNEWGAYNFVALTDVNEGEEIRFDYETTELEITAFSKCMCGAKSCRGYIRGFKFNSTITDKYDKHVAGYLTESSQKI